MRLSHPMAIALLFGSVLANPAPVDPKDQPPEKGKGTQRDRSGSQSSGSTDAGFDLTKENRGWGSIPGTHFVPQLGDLSNAQRRKLRMSCKHPVLLLGSSSSDPSKVYYTPMSHDFRQNPSIISEPAAKYITGNKMDDTSKIHTGEPKVTALKNVRVFQPDQKDFQISDHDRKRLLRKMRYNTDLGGPSPHGTAGERGRDSPPRTLHPSEPTNSYSRGRDPTMGSDRGGRGRDSRSRSPVGPNGPYRSRQRTYRQRTGEIPRPPPPQSVQSLPPWRQPAAGRPLPPPQSGQSLPPWRQPASARPPSPQRYGQSLPPWRQPARPKDANRRFNDH